MHTFCHMMAAGRDVRFQHRAGRRVEAWGLIYSGSLEAPEIRDTDMSAFRTADMC